MKLKDIQVGSHYACSINPRQVVGLTGDSIFSEPRIVGSFLLADVKDRAFAGYKAQVVEILKNTNGRRCVLVECVAMRVQQHEKSEDNYDGTRIQWRGMTIDEEGAPVLVERSFEANISPQQIIKPWLDAQVETGMKQMENTLRRHPERIFGEVIEDGLAES